MVRFLTILAAALTFYTTAQAGLYREITIDGDFSDWAGVPLAAQDAFGDSGSTVDFADLYLANDGDFLYVRFTLHASADPFTFLSNSFFDTDANVSTGFAAVGGTVGSEMLIQSGVGYQEKNGGFNEGGVTGLDYLRSGNSSQTDFEFRVSLNSTFTNDNTPVFSGSQLAILLETDRPDFSGVADVLSGGVMYSLAAIPEPSAFLFGTAIVAGKSLSGRRRRSVISSDEPVER
jgi:hypothetical protein